MFIFNHISFRPSGERRSLYPLSNSGDHLNSDSHINANFTRTGMQATFYHVTSPQFEIEHSSLSKANLTIRGHAPFLRAT